MQASLTGEWGGWDCGGGGGAGPQGVLMSLGGGNDGEKDQGAKNSSFSDSERVGTALRLGQAAGHSGDPINPSLDWVNPISV